MVFAATDAEAAAIGLGTYQLHNHPDGASNPPPYGLRLDELYNPTGGNDIFTFNFDAPGSDMKLEFDGSTIHIFGTTLGGRDIGAAHAADNFLGLYAIDFTYSVGVKTVVGDDDQIVEPGANGLNTGTITPLGMSHPSVGVAVNLGDVQNAENYSFRLGDENNDNGHRGFNGISGWGWLSVNGDDHAGQYDDFLFTAELIPEPMTAGLMLMGFGVIGLRRRR